MRTSSSADRLLSPASPREGQRRPPSGVQSWKLLTFGALAAFAFVTLISKMIHAENAHDLHHRELHAGPGMHYVRLAQPSTATSHRSPLPPVPAAASAPAAQSPTPAPARALPTKSTPRLDEDRQLATARTSLPRLRPPPPAPPSTEAAPPVSVSRALQPAPVVTLHLEQADQVVAPAPAAYSKGRFTRGAAAAEAPPAGAPATAPATAPTEANSANLSEHLLLYTSLRNRPTSTSYDTREGLASDFSSPLSTPSALAVISAEANLTDRLAAAYEAAHSKVAAGPAAACPGAPAPWMPHLAPPPDTAPADVTFFGYGGGGGVQPGAGEQGGSGAAGGGGGGEAPRGGRRRGPGSKRAGGGALVTRPGGEGGSAAAAPGWAEANSFAGQAVPRGMTGPVRGMGRPGVGRRLLEFKKAGRGGKKGLSCVMNATLKARQACAESRALLRCEFEESSAAELGLREGEDQLVECLLGTPACKWVMPDLRAAARRLTGIKLLARGRPNCLFQNAEGECSGLEENAETALYMGGCGQRGGGPLEGCNMTAGFALPRTDLTHRYDTCAVVGNSMSLFKTSNGESIDEHDAVFRFNNEVARMVHVLQGQGQDIDHTSILNHIGSKSTFRLLNRKYTNQMLDAEKKAAQGKGVSEDDLARDDFVVFWHYFSAPYLRHLQERYPAARLYLMAPDMVNWELAIFSALRADFLRMRLGPFECYRFMSSGMHGLLLALLTCSQVDVYGFSVSMLNFAAGFNHGRPSESHSWAFETMLMRLFHIVGAVDVCNT